MLNLLMLADAAAPAAPSSQSSGGGSMMGTLLFAAAVFAILYFLMIRPQKKKEQQRKDLLSKVQRGDKIVTIGGMYGEVESIKDEYVILLVDSERGTTLKFRRSAIHEILAGDSGSTEDQKK